VRRDPESAAFADANREAADVVFIAYVAVYHDPDTHTKDNAGD
jgi:hypothetical protein